MPKICGMLQACLFVALFYAISARNSHSSPDLSSQTAQSNEKYPFFPHSPAEEQRIRKMVDEINSMNLPWKAEYNAQASLEGEIAEDFEFRADYKTIEQIDNQFWKHTTEHMNRLAEVNISLPESFDARDKWPRCASLHAILNQGGCGSCWAAASVSVMSDRLCISSNFTEQEMISLQDLVSCCEYCGSCTGGSIEKAFHYWKNTGIVTGSHLGSNEGCKPYEIESTCGVPCPPHFYTPTFNPTCSKKCNNLYGIDYDADLRKGKSYYMVTTTYKPPQEKSELIKKEIFLNGPVVFSTSVDEPFAHYRSGIYTGAPVEGHKNLEYGHAMRIIGWGKEKGEDYWTIANSWGRQWGENGYARLSVNYRPEELQVIAGLW